MWKGKSKTKQRSSWRKAMHSSVARLWKLAKHVRASFKARLEGLKAMETGAKQYEKEGHLFSGPQNVRNSRRAKMRIPSLSFQPQLLLVKSASTWNKGLSRFATIKAKKGLKLDLQGGTTFDFKRVTFRPLFETFFPFPRLLAFARLFNTFNCMLHRDSELTKLMHTYGRLLIERPQKWTGGVPVHNPISRHDSIAQQKTTKIQTRKPNKNKHKPKQETDTKTHKMKSDRQSSSVILVIGWEVTALYHL